MWEFSIQPLADGFSLDFELQQVSSSLQDSSKYSTDLNNAIVWVVSTRPLISKSSTLSSNPSVSILSILTTTGITVTFMFHSLFSSLARSRYLSFFLLSFSFTQWLAGTAKSTIRQVLLFFFFFTTTKSGRLAEITWSVCIVKSQRVLSVSFSRTISGLCVYYLSVWSNSNFLQNSCGSPLLLLVVVVVFAFISCFSHALVWLNLGLNPGIPDHWRTLYSCILGRLVTEIVPFRRNRWQRIFHQR